MSKSTSAAAPNITFRIGAFRIALQDQQLLPVHVRRRMRRGGLAARFCRLRVPVDLGPVNIAARIDVVVEPASNTCCNWRKSSANSAPLW